MNNITDIDVNQLVGDTIKFRTYHITDTAIICGKVAAICDSRTALLVSDIAHYSVGVNTGLVAEGLSPLGSYDGEKFIILELENGVRKSYCIDWIKNGIYETVAATQNVFIQLRGVTASQVAEVMTTLLSMDIVAKVVNAKLV